MLVNFVLDICKIFYRGDAVYFKVHSVILSTISDTKFD